MPLCAQTQGPAQSPQWVENGLQAARVRNGWKADIRPPGDWKQAALAREFIAALRAGDLGANELVEGRSVAEWTVWAEERAAEMDPTGHGLEELFADVGAGAGSRGASA